MNILTCIMACFSVLGAIDCILNNRFKIGKEWERGFQMIGTMALSMIGMIVLAPTIAHVLSPLLAKIPEGFPFESSVLAGSFLANDMGGANLAVSLAKNRTIGEFNGLVVGAMMGATTSFTLPLAMGMVQKKQQRFMLLGLLCGIVTIPVGCLIAGLIGGIPFVTLCIDLLPLVVLAVILAVGLMRAPDLCVKIFRILGICVKVVITLGMAVGILEFLLGISILPYAAPLEDGILIVFNAAVVMSGAFPLLRIVGVLLRKPLRIIGKKMQLNQSSTLGFVASLATNVTTFSMMKDMDERGVVLNSAFAVSGAFTFAGHLAFTMSFAPEWVSSVMIGKLAAGICAIFVAYLVLPKGKEIA